MKDKIIKLKTKKKVMEPVVKDSEWEAVIAYLEWFRKLSPELQGAATHLDEIVEVRRR